MHRAKLHSVVMEKHFNSKVMEFNEKTNKLCNYKY